MAFTYEPIQTYTLGSDGIISFTSIPSTYTDLVLVFNGGITQNYWNPAIRINDDATSNYSWTVLTGQTSGPTSTRAASATLISFGGGDAGTISNSINCTGILYIQQYKNTSVTKSILSKGSSPQTGVSIYAGTWNSTAAITKITVGTQYSGGTLVNALANSQATLYGIKAA